MLRISDDDITHATAKVQIAPTKKHFYYHMGYWVDLNGDGRKDFITARTNGHGD